MRISIYHCLAAICFAGAYTAIGLHVLGPESGFWSVSFKSCVTFSSGFVLLGIASIGCDTLDQWQKSKSQRQNKHRRREKEHFQRLHEIQSDTDYQWHKPHHLP